MLVNKEIAQEIYEEAGEARVYRAKDFIKEAKVEIKKVTYDDKNNFEVSGEVEGNNGIYTTRIHIKNGEIEEVLCECEDFYKRYGTCKHIAATLMKFEQSKYWDKTYTGEENKPKQNNKKITSFRKIVTTLYNEEFQELNLEDVETGKNVKIDTRIVFDRFESKLKLEFKIGNSRMYKMRDLLEFYTRMKTNEFHKYGDKLEFVHIRENFEEDSREILDFILKYAEMLKNAENTNAYNYYVSSFNCSSIPLGEGLIDEAFDILKNKKINLDIGKNSYVLNFEEKDIDINFKLIKSGKEQYKLKANKDIYNLQIYKGKKYIYVLDDSTLYRCNKALENTVLKLIELLKNNYVSELDLVAEDIRDLYSIVIPKFGKCIDMESIDKEDLEKYKPQKLGVKLYLDYDANDYIIADVKFCYDKDEFNPLEEDVQINSTRNILDENKSLNILRKTGFMIDVQNSRFILPEEEKIYNFLENDIELYMQKFEVLATEKFKTKEIRKPKLGTIGVKVENNLLSVDLSKIDINIKELQNIMNKYHLKKKYYRLKDGSFLNLEENKDIEFLDKLITGMDIGYKELEKESIKLPINRTLYLNELLKNQEISKISTNNEFQKIVNDLERENINEDVKLPEEMDKILRDYQKVGFRWLKALDMYHFGGILADDMGLGKTLQIISIILDYIQNTTEKRKTTLVVSPSSLTLNWENEIKKFAPELKVKVVKGNVQERKQIISELEEYDILITSYDLLKRDVEKYKTKNYIFRYIIADEAQYMKNSTTQNAKAIKELNSEARFALTGTPIENSLSELWSIFDFIMPGYLFSYKKFKTIYEIPIVKEEDKKAMEKLKMLIQPFILRRNKKDVLTELPEKTITVINNQMTDEQQNVYMAYLAQIKQEVADEISEIGFEKSQIKILAALTRLRQICCHPGLFIRDYTGESSKLTQCLDIVNDAISSGHKILLFSGYTSMFDIIEKELEEKGIKYFKLTGNTKVDERINLVEEFNSNKDIKVFLISLKAGGTGLNLTGADMVIHYDPWWNQSAENQATDRAYRIGQKNNVQVYKLITSNSIEEKIYELQQKKAVLIDNMLDTRTSFINKLSKEEIMSLFE